MTRATSTFVAATPTGLRFSRTTLGPRISATLRISALPCSNRRSHRTITISMRSSGPACDIRHRFAISAVYDIPAWDRSGVVRAVSKDWHLSTVYQVQTGFPFTISVFGDTANSGTVLGENPIRANLHGTAHLHVRHTHGRELVQYRCICRASRVYVRRRGPKLGVWSGDADARSGLGPRLQPDGACEVPIPR